MPGHKDKTRNARTWDQGLKPGGEDLGYKGNKARDETPECLDSKARPEVTNIL